MNQSNPPNSPIENPSPAANTDNEQLPIEAEERGLALDIIIGEDGEVIFTDLPPELIDVALALDPDSPLACRRTEAQSVNESD